MTHIHFRDPELLRSVCMSERNYQDLIAECDQLIKAGKIRQVAHLIAKLNIASVPRQWRQALAKICRRSSMAAQGLRLLHPVVRAEKNAQAQPASHAEICEYAVLLMVSGSLQEAIALLETVRDDRTPEALLYSGFCEVARWEYDTAAELYQAYLESSADEYSKLTARINLASSYVVLAKYLDAKTLLTETILLAEKAGAKRLAGNGFELLGQVYFWLNQYPKARLHLDRAHEIFSQAGSFDELQIHKTRSIMLALESNSCGPLEEFRKLATSRRHWDSVREADLFKLKVDFQQAPLDHLIFGTPLQGYRRRIEQIVGHSPSESYVLGAARSPRLDMQTGKVTGKKTTSLGTKNHQVLAALIKDFYRPCNLGTLFSELYPGEFFNVNSSPFRVRQTVMRARQWLEENELPAEIQQSKGAYRFHIHGKFSLQLALHPESVSQIQIKCLQLTRAFETVNSFTADEACAKLQWSRMTFLRVIDAILSSGQGTKLGGGRYTRYSVSKQVTRSAA